MTGVVGDIRYEQHKKNSINEQRWSFGFVMPINKILARQGREGGKIIWVCLGARLLDLDRRYSNSDAKIKEAGGFLHTERDDYVLLRKEWTLDYNGRHVVQHWLERKFKTTHRSPLTERTISAT